MEKKNCFKRITSMALLFMMVLASIYTGEMPVQAAPSGTSSATSRKYVTLVRTGAEILGPSFKGDEAGATVHRFTYPTATVKDTAGTAGYCIEPFARGVSPSGQAQTFTTVPADQLDDLDKKLLGIMMAGYPTVTHGKSAADEYMATQIAIQHFVFQHPDKYPNSKKVKFNDDSWSRWSSSTVVELAKVIYNQGIANPYVTGSSTNTEIKAAPENNGRLENDGDNLVVNISLEVSGTFPKGKLTLPDEIRSLVKSGKGSITVNGITATFKPYILGSDDTYEGIEIKPGDAEVIITLDKLSAEAYVPAPNEIKSVDFSFEIIGGDALQAHKGVNLNNSNQDYIFIAPGETEPVVAALSWTRDFIPVMETEPGDGGLKVLKYNAKTNQLTSDAIFEIRGVSESNWDFLVHIQASPGAAIPLPDGGTATTGVGTITLSGIRPGQYQITEITPPPNFDYCDFGINSQVVTVVSGIESGLYPQVRFENNPFGALRLRKTDAVTGSPVNGAILRIRNPIANIDVEMVTMNGGIIDMKNLPQGNYEISEVFAPSKYVKSDEVKIVTIRWGETTDITFVNQPKTELLVKKTDADSGINLSGTVIRLTKPDTGETWDDTTYFDGYAVFQDIPEGTYTVEEIAAPIGYTLDTTKYTVVVTNGKINEITLTNRKKPGIVLKKYDEGTGLPLPLAELRVALMNGQIVYEGMTDENGEIRLDDLEPGWYKITEIAAPPGYLIATQPKDVYLEPGQQLEVKFDNRRRPALELLKLDAITNEPQAGAIFRIRKAESAIVSEYITDANGRIYIADLDEAVYSVTEIGAPDGYILDSQRKDILLEWGKIKELVFTNTRMPALILSKLNGLSHLPVQGATYKIAYETSSGGVVTLGTFVTDINGQIVIPKVNPGWYIITETKPAPGYSLPSNPTTRLHLSPGENAYLSSPSPSPTPMLATDDGITVSSGYDFMLSTESTLGEPIFNYPLNSIVMKKTSAATGELLANAVFGLYRADEQVSGVPGTLIGRYTTDATGVVVVTGLPSGYYVVKEEQAPPHYFIGENSMQNGFLKPDGTTVLEFTFSNIPYGSILIAKKDGDTSKPLPGAVFKVTDATGAVVGSANGLFTTDSNGEILIPHVKPGSYIISEERAPANYALDAAPQVIEVGTDGKTYRVDFINTKLGSAQIVKKDAATKQPLKNALFTVYKASGEVVGTYETDGDGMIILPHLANGWYKAVESRAPEGYLLDDTPKDFQITGNDFVKLVFENTKLTGLQLKKKDATTKSPIGDVTFSVSFMNSEKIGDFTTDKNGLVFVPNLAPGWYTVVETKAADGYIIDSTPHNIEVKHGQNAVLELENTAAASLLLVKTDEQNNKPLANVLYEIRRADGQRVVGSLQEGNQPGTANNSPNHYASPNGDMSSFYLTDANGRILINHLAPGEYQAIERQQLEGYELDENVYPVTVTPGKQAVLRLTNKPLAGLRLLKRDSVSKLGIFNTEFMLFDANNKVVGTFYTDNMGVIDFPRDISVGRYTLRETRAAEGYYRDDVPRTVEFVAGKVTEIVWENTPYMGQIQLFKKSGDDNQVNGLPSGTPLAGAVFEVYAHKSGNLVDRFTSSADGRAVSRPLPLGRYLVKEVQSPQWYRISEQTLDLTIEFPTQIIKQEFVNYSANTGVTMRKTGNREAMAGDVIRYDIKALRNDSTVPLTDFYFRDVLPVDAVRLTKIVTGTYNQNLRYKVMITTNKGDTKTIADNLSTTANNVLDCSNAALGLRSDEYVTNFTFVFGTVKAGFSMVDTPQVLVRVVNGLPNGYIFANKVDIGGKHGREWVIGNSVWSTEVFAPKKGALPRTGY